MSYIKIMVHCVWRVKDNKPVLVSEKRGRLFEHILKNAKEKGIFIDTIGGFTDHVHCLLSLGGSQTISDVIKSIKGESSHWANKEGLLSYKLEWAEDYFAAAVNESSLKKTRAYIMSQEEHHKKVTFKEEYEKFLKSHGFKLG